MSISINQISSFCQTHVVPKLVDNVYDSSALANILFKKAKKWPGGTYFEVPIQYAKNSNAESFGAAASLTIGKVEEVTKAQFSAHRYNCAIALEGLDLAMNSGSAKVLNLVNQKMKLAEKALIDLFGTDIIGSHSTNDIYGLTDICAAGASTLGGVASGDASEWLSSSGSLGRANGPDSSTTSLTRLVLDKQFNSCKLDNDKPDLLITTDAIWSGISATFLQPNMRYTNGKMADLGFENFKYRTAYAYTDDHVGAGDLYFLNTEHLYFAVFSSMNFKFIPWDKATNSDVHIAHIRWYGGLICDERRKQGWMSAITGVA